MAHPLQFILFEGPILEFKMPERCLMDLDGIEIWIKF
jgi:hypothetical protein